VNLPLLLFDGRKISHALSPLFIVVSFSLSTARHLSFFLEPRENPAPTFIVFDLFPDDFSPISLMMALPPREISPSPNAPGSGLSFPLVAPVELALGPLDLFFSLFLQPPVPACC